MESGIRAENLLVLGRIAEEHQYFDLPYLHFGKEEVFVDAGGFNGDTSFQFSRVTKNVYEKIYIFEPNKILADECRKKLKCLNNCEVIQKGTWNTSQVLRFIEDGEGSRIDDTSDNVVEVETISIDEALDGKKATYIKMDIEGAEMYSLLGAEKTIRKYKPKLAISVYHKRDDIWEIPMLLLKYNPAYRFYLRIYSFTGNDAVLYAI